jgi:hypothetical protein
MEHQARPPARFSSVLGTSENHQNRKQKTKKPIYTKFFTKPQFSVFSIQIQTDMPVDRLFTDLTVFCRANYFFGVRIGSDGLGSGFSIFDWKHRRSEPE